MSFYKWGREDADNLSTAEDFFGNSNLLKAEFCSCCKLKTWFKLGHFVCLIVVTTPDTTQAPTTEVTSQALDDTTQVPDDTTQAPDVTSQVPLVSTQTPAVTTQAPAVTSQAPLVTTQTTQSVETTPAGVDETTPPDETTPAGVDETTLHDEIIPPGETTPAVVDDATPPGGTDSTEIVFTQADDVTTDAEMTDATTEAPSLSPL